MYSRSTFPEPFVQLLTEIKWLHPRQFWIEDPPGMTQMLGSKWAMAAFQRGDDPQRRWSEELEA